MTSAAIFIITVIVKPDSTFVTTSLKHYHHPKRQRLVFYFSSSPADGCHPAPSGTNANNKSSGRACEAELSFMQLALLVRDLSRPPGQDPGSIARS